MLYKVEAVEKIDETRSWLNLSDKDGKRIDKVGYVGTIKVGDFLNGDISTVKQNDKTYLVFKREQTQEPKPEPKPEPKQEKSGYELKDEKIARQGFMNQAMQIIPYMKDLSEWAKIVKKLEPVYIKYVIKGELDLKDLEDKNE
jgi:hypothetical protein